MNDMWYEQKHTTFSKFLLRSQSFLACQSALFLNQEHLEFIYNYVWYISTTSVLLTQHLLVLKTSWVFFIWKLFDVLAVSVTVSNLPVSKNRMIIIIARNWCQITNEANERPPEAEWTFHLIKLVSIMPNWNGLHKYVICDETIKAWKPIHN